MKTFLKQHPQIYGKTTGFIFLFHQIYRVMLEDQDDSNWHIFYNFPNNARKFLECCLFFKYPDSILGKAANDKRTEQFLGKGVLKIFQNRINNEYSHGEEQFDRLSYPVIVPEMKKDATIIIEKIRTWDYEQYASLCRSIGEEPSARITTE